MISDSIEGRLAAEADRLPRVRARTSLAIGLVPALAVLVWASGAAVPRLGYGSGGGDWSETTGERYITAKVDQGFVNRGWMPVTVTGVGVRGEGFALRRVEPADFRFPRTVGPGEELRLALAFDVEDCAAVWADPPEAVLEVSRWWGSQAVTVSPDETDGPREWISGPGLCSR